MKTTDIKKEYRKDPASLQNRFCYTGEEIKGYMDGTISPGKRSDIGVHLNIEKCSRCRQLFTLIDLNNDKESDDVEALKSEKLETTEYTPAERKIFERIKNRKKRANVQPVPFNVKNRVEKGQIWTTSPKPRTMQGQQIETVDFGVPVLIVDNGTGHKKLSNIIRVMPLSFDTEFHSTGETLCFDSSGPLGYPVLVEIFNERPMLAGNLSRFRNTVAKSDMDKIDALLKQYRYGDSDTGETGTKRDASVGKNETETDSDKEMTSWQRKEMALCEYLTLPVNQSLLDEEDIEIEVSEYKRAADETGISDVEIKAMLIDNDEYRFFILQERELILLRFASNTLKPEKIMLDGNAVEIRNPYPEEFDVEIGKADSLPEKMVITLLLEEENFEFQVLLK
ncbi:MAG: hypothetical protein HQK65_08650 [Desulfamplus sp.]|nr:hypothetical protein [Desulfamplus sp.]